MKPFRLPWCFPHHHARPVAQTTPRLKYSNVYETYNGPAFALTHMTRPANAQRGTYEVINLYKHNGRRIKAAMEQKARSFIIVTIFPLSGSTNKRTWQRQRHYSARRRITWLLIKGDFTARINFNEPLWKYTSKPRSRW